MDTWRRLGFLAGQFGLMCLVRFFFQWVIRFAKQPVEASAELGAATLFSSAAVGAALLAFRIFDGVTDPIAGVLGDAWVRRGRERRSLLWFAFTLPAVGLLLSFAPQPAMGIALRWTLLLAGMFVFFVGYTLYAIPFWSLIEDYAQGSADERRTLSNLLGAGILLATAAAFVLSPALVQRWGFFRAAAAFALASTAFMALPYFCAPPGAVESASSSGRARRRVGWSSVLEALRHRRFVAVVVLFGGSQMSFTVMTSAAPFIAERLLGGTDADVARLLGPFLATAIPFFCVTPAISRRLGWARAIVLASVALGGVYAATSLLGRGVIGGPWTTAAIVFALGGPLAAVLLGLEGEAITACARERAGSDGVSVYFGVFNFLVKALNGVAIFVAGALAELGDAAPWRVRAIQAMSWSAGAMLLVCTLTAWWLHRGVERRALAQGA